LLFIYFQFNYLFIFSRQIKSDKILQGSLSRSLVSQHSLHIRVLQWLQQDNLGKFCYYFVVCVMQFTVSAVKHLIYIM